MYIFLSTKSKKTIETELVGITKTKCGEEDLSIYLWSEEWIWHNDVMSSATSSIFFSVGWVVVNRCRGGFLRERTRPNFICNTCI